MTSRFQFTLRRIFAWVFLAALLGASGVWWRWWNQTRHMRALSDAISDSSLSADTKIVLNKLAWTPAAWEGGLIQRLVGASSAKQIVWKGSTNCGGDLYIFDAFVRPTADQPVPLVCVLVDQSQNLLAWSTVAPYSLGLLDASLDSSDVLTITTVANWFHGKGKYQYAIQCQEITPLNEGVFEKFSDEESGMELPEPMPRDTAFDGALEPAGEWQ